VNSGERPEKKQEKETDWAVLMARSAGHDGVVVAVDGYGGRRWFFFFSPLLLLLPLFFIRSVNNILPSLRWSRAVQLVTAKKKNSAATGGSRRRRERG
jgi:hypothetical protein